MPRAEVVVAKVEGRDLGPSVAVEARAAREAAVVVAVAGMALC